MFNFAWRRRTLCARKRARHVAPVTLGLLPLSVMPSFAQADNTASGVTLPSVTITASAPNPVTVDPNLPATVETVTPAQFQNWNVVNSEDVDHRRSRYQQQSKRARTRLRGRHVAEQSAR
jgi:iron complex outermembrane receptor protein